MRIAAISDIHSNIFALDAVLADIRDRGVDITVNLGDILYGPIAPKATYDRLMDANLITIRGNQDRQIYESTPDEIAANPTLQFILHDLGQEPLEWMRSLPPNKQLNNEVFLCHGTPGDDLIYFLEDVTNGKPALRNDQEIIELLNGQESPVILCGHTHIPRSVVTSTGQLIVNTGSVGLPAYRDTDPSPHAMETFSPWASYAIIEQGPNGWRTELIKTPYDHKQAATKALLRKRNDWAAYLATGRA